MLGTASLPLPVPWLGSTENPGAGGIVPNGPSAALRLYHISATTTDTTPTDCSRSRVNVSSRTDCSRSPGTGYNPPGIWPHVADIISGGGGTCFLSFQRTR